MKTFFASVLGGFVALMLFCILGFLMLATVIAGLATSMGNSGPKQPASIVLQLDLREAMPDQPATEGLAAVFQQNAFLNVLEKLDAAAGDDHVKGVFIRASDTGIGSSRAEELREAIHKLRDNGKFVVAHSQGLMGTGPSALRAISAADELDLQPGSDVAVGGVAFETMFMKDLFDKLSVTAEIEQFYQYKNAPNVYKETDYTAPHREAMTKLGEDIWSVSVADIAADRGFEDVAALRSILEAGPLGPQEAVDAGLFDELKWPEDSLEAAKERGGKKAEIVEIADYTPPAVDPNAPAIAVVGGEGAIVTGPGSKGPFDNEAVFASDRVAAALLEAGKDEKVRAVVFRVDSGGGSPVASDQIWRAVQRVREEYKKPVVVSMGSMAASGGYYVSAGADAIVANRTTLTGSIGVFGGKFAIADGLRKIGINPSTITVGGDFASAYNTETFSDETRALLHESLERTYDRFMMIVSTGREIPEARVREIARGRVWSGLEAEKLQLVNELGGYLDAVEKAKELADIAPETEVRLLKFPAAGDPFSALSDLLGASAESAEAAARINAILGDKNVRALIAQSQALQKGEAQMSAPLITEN